MPFVETRLISPTTLTTSAASALYTVPTGYSAIIKQLVVTNITGTPATFTFYIGAASAGNALFSGTSVAANDTVIINLSQVLSTGEILRALASTGSALNLTVSGVINDGPLASTATYIPDNAITSAKIAAGAVSSVKLVDSLSLTGIPTAPTATAGTNTAQIATMASRPWNMAWGIIGYAAPLQASFITTSSTAVDVTGMSISFTGIANRRYRINFNASQIWGTSGDRAVLRFTGTNISPFKSYYFNLLPSSSGIAGSYSHLFTATGAAIVKLQFYRDSGSGTASIYADTAEAYGHFYLEDMGPA